MKEVHNNYIITWRDFDNAFKNSSTIVIKSLTVIYTHITHITALKMMFENQNKGLQHRSPELKIKRGKVHDVILRKENA